jgi:hypothetical protein
MSPTWVRVLLALAMVLSTLHIAAYGSYVVDDAAISFAYSRHWVDGHGLVPWVGGERVEGYSNPSWVLLVALAYRLGIGPFFAAKWLAMFFTAATVPLTYRLTQLAREDEAPAVPLLAVFAFVCTTQVGLYGAAGLETPLFGFLIAAGILGTHADGASNARWPRGALVWLLLALTRPEGIVYAALGGLFFLIARYRRGVWMASVAGWLALFFTPFLAYHAARYAYFAWPLPMTFYSKTPRSRSLTHLDGMGWIYMAAYARAQLALVWLVPQVGAVVMGSPRRSWAVGAVAVVAVAGVINPLAWLVGAGLLTAVVVGGRGWVVRGMCWGASAFAVFFAVNAGGDWMSGHRWLAPVAVPGAVLLVVGVSDLVALWSNRPRGVARGMTAAVVALFVVTNLREGHRLTSDVPASVVEIGLRVRVVERLFDALHLEERGRFLIGDMGGFLYWSTIELVDLVGLTDVPFALHRRSRVALVDSYVFDERLPHAIRLPLRYQGPMTANPRYRKLYVSHGGELAVLRSTLLRPGPAERVLPLEHGVEWVTWEVESPSVAVGTGVRLSIEFRNPLAVDIGARAQLMDEEGRMVALWNLDHHRGVLDDKAMGEDIFHGRYDLVLDEALEEGSYTLSLAARSSQGWIAQGSTFAWPASVELVAEGTAQQAAEQDMAVFSASASAGACEEAVVARRKAAGHRIGVAAFEEGLEQRTAPELALCWLARARSEPDQRVDHLERARKLAPSHPEVRAAVGALADELHTQADTHRERRKFDKAFEGYLKVLRLEPHRAWARRHAEDIRGRRIARGR